MEYYPTYTPSHDSKELREEEGIPDLEDEYQQEVVKEVYGEQKFVAVEKVGGGGNERSRGIGGEVEYGVRSSTVGESSGNAREKCSFLDCYGSWLCKFRQGLHSQRDLR